MLRAVALAYVFLKSHFLCIYNSNKTEVFRAVMFTFLAYEFQCKSVSAGVELEAENTALSWK
jgi:hypothetical protein